MQLLKLEQGVEVERVDVEQVLEQEHVEVVVASELLEQGQVQRVDVEQVVEVGLLEQEIVELAKVNGLTLCESSDSGLRGSRGSNGDGPEGRGEESGKLHVF